jgi:hypothetical protein
MMGAGLERIVGGRFNLTVGEALVSTADLIGWSFFAVSDLDAGTLADQTSGTGLGGGVAQPASKTSAQKMIPTDLNTPPLCGTEKRTQAVLGFS